MMVKAFKLVLEAKFREIFFQIILPGFMILQRLLAPAVRTAPGDIARNHTLHSGKPVENLMDKRFLHLFIRITQARNYLGVLRHFVEGRLDLSTSIFVE